MDLLPSKPHVVEWADRLILHVYGTGVPCADARRLVALVLVLKWVKDCVALKDTEVYRLSLRSQMTAQEWADIESDILANVRYRLDLV